MRAPVGMALACLLGGCAGSFTVDDDGKPDGDPDTHVTDSDGLFDSDDTARLDVLCPALDPADLLDPSAPFLSLTDGAVAWHPATGLRMWGDAPTGGDLLTPDWIHDCPIDPNGAIAGSFQGRTACLVEADGDVVCCPVADLLAPALPRTGLVDLSGFGDVACAVTSAGTLHCADGLPIPPSGLPASLQVEILWDTDGHEICALLATGGVHCFGRTGFANDTDLTHGCWQRIALGANGTWCALGRDGSIRCSSSEFFELEQVPAGTRYRALVLSRQNACVLDAAGAIQCWGPMWTAAALDASSAPPVVTDLPAERGFVALSVGVNTGCAMRDDGEVLCWGDPASGIVREAP